MSTPHPWHCGCSVCKPTLPDTPIGVVAWLVEGVAIVWAPSWYAARNECRLLGFEPTSVEICPTYRRKKNS